MVSDYLSSLFLKSNVPYQVRDNTKLVQSLKRTTAFGLKYFVYFGAATTAIIANSTVCIGQFASTISMGESM